MNSLPELRRERGPPRPARTGRSRPSTSAGAARRRRTARRCGSGSARPGACFSGLILPRMNRSRSAGAKRDRQQRRDEHDERLRVGERLEQPPRLAGQREHRQERHRDDQQREEDRRRDLLGRLDQQRVPVARPGRRAPASCAPPRSSRSAASTVAPIAMAMPPRLMIVDGMSSSTIGMNDSATLIGSDRIGSSELRKWSRNSMITRLTTIASSMSACLSVSIDALDEARAVVGERQLDARRGSWACSSANFFFTRSMTSSAFSP